MSVICDSNNNKNCFAPEPKKRVMFMISSLAGGGAERVTVNLSNSLCDAYDVCVVTLFNNPDDYVPDERVELFRFSDYTAGMPKLKRKIIKGCSYLVKLLWVRNLKRDWKPEATISMLTIPNLFNALTDCGDFRIVSERADPSIIGGSYYRRAKVSSLLADHTVFQSRRVQMMFSDRVQKKSSIILNPVTVSCSADENREKRIVTAGRLDEQKNHLMLIRAFSRFAAQHPGYTLEIYGKGHLKGRLEDEINALGLGNRAFIRDFSNDLHDSIKSAEMFVLSSDFEGLSNALLESMMMGIPCISTDCAGSDEIIEDGQNGLLVPVGDGEALCAAMTELADDPVLRKTIATEAKRQSERFSRETVMKQWIELIEKSAGEDR